MNVVRATTVDAYHTYLLQVFILPLATSIDMLKSPFK